MAVTFWGLLVLSLSVYLRDSSWAVTTSSTRGKCFIPLKKLSTVLWWFSAEASASVSSGIGSALTSRWGFTIAYTSGTFFDLSSESWVYSKSVKRSSSSIRLKLFSSSPLLST